ncbi:elongation factor 4 [Candidatus Amesbacteria bacterium RIFOXYB1_FULL_44_23]|uniref:Elongation factor 4 n=1 Tax=Candidatus Amesbacteria bacterium RIFOXYB1_FULL_44_23 TaxID=1797263 RepID=A0A1F4ZS98_9BACT|nr:MAG: elongation factor 4 [Candidatus Amesbacteria bacterium RIFOXYB1_FULL_44_23]
MQNIRNFAIIAHIDHGKSTLADRMLEITGTISKRDMQNQILDSNPIERERGITIKLAPVRMNYSLNGNDYILNLIDTPGHVDFSYEVSRSLAACEGAILLVDATQGVQAQTLAHYHEATKLNLPIIPVINKIDVNTADIPGAVSQMQDIFGFKPEELVYVSGKTGLGVPELLETVIKKIPSPTGAAQGELRALVFNSNFDTHLGVVAWVRVVDGSISPHQQIILKAANISTNAIEVGVFTPTKKPTDIINAGEVGYVVTGLRDISDLKVGDTVSTSTSTISLPGYKPIQPVVFVSFYPNDGEDINVLRDALSKLRLQDSSLQYTPEFSPALGNGFRVGLLGLLHADIVQERLEREFNLSLIAAAPSVGYQIVTKSDQLISISRPMDLPDPSIVAEIKEPVINLSVFVPERFIGAVMQLCQDHRGSLINIEYLGKLAHLSYSLPMSELIHGFYDQLKSISQGFATLDYELSGFVAADLVKLDILISGDKIDSLSQIVPKSKSPQIARDLVERLKNIIPKQQFEIVIQAGIGSHILARADIKAFRKDVIAKLSGGDQTRKDKLLKKQKKGKARMKRMGKIDLPQEAFLSILRL